LSESTDSGEVFLRFEIQRKWALILINFKYELMKTVALMMEVWSQQAKVLFRIQ